MALPGMAAESEQGVALRDEDVVPVALAEGQHNEILVTEILPTWTEHAVPQGKPVVVVCHRDVSGVCHWMSVVLP
ncbi:hypothetical protein [Streptomyces atratus]|uniref:hypothetical protein n=1 Tax=Streptomyces atratus TaxID=1893 RepID=UPI00225205B3|nr:hypothetical protein [Streptomyces atratus]MCX5346100.1 hypothetical protein [Streptomyces atratus]